MDIIYIILFVLLSILYFSYNRNYIEGYESFENVNNKVYAKLYNIIFDEDKLYKNDINNIVNYIFKNKNKNKNNIKILDAGCGAGRHYQYLNKNYPTVGVDVSNELIKYAKVRTPKGNFINDNLINDKIFEHKEFNVIVSLLDSIYHNNMTDIDKIIKNFYYWLKDDGYICLHLFNRKKLDPGAREHTQYYKDSNGIKHGLTYFNNFTHDAYWREINNDSVEYIETVVLPNSKKKISKTVLYIPKDNNKIIESIENNGFNLEKILSVKNENDMELYIFKKIKFNDEKIKL